MDTNAIIESLASFKNSRSSNIYDSLSKSAKKLVMSRLKEYLKSDNSKLALKAAIILGDIKTQESFDTLLSGLSNPQSWVRREIITSLGKIGYKSAAPYIRELLAVDIRTSISKEFSEWISYIRKSDFLQKDYSDEELTFIFESVIEAEIRTLGQLRDEDAINLLSEALRYPDKSVRLIAAEALGMIGSARGLKPLIEALNNTETSRNVLAQIVYSMKFIGNPAAIKYLKACPKLSSKVLKNLKEHVIEYLKKNK